LSLALALEPPCRLPAVLPGDCHAPSRNEADNPHLITLNVRKGLEDAGRVLWLPCEFQPRHEWWQRTGAPRVRMSVWLLPDSPGDGGPIPLPGLLRHETPLYRLPGSSASQGSAGRYMAALPYAALHNGLARLGRLSADTFSLAHLFHRRLRIELEPCAGEGVLTRNPSQVELYDTGQFGSLYRRLMERLVQPDTVAQATRLGLGTLSERFHPWFPVLAIGMDKARLYMEAIENDAAWHTVHLPDPRWLMRVGLYLELLTCLGIIEAVRPEYPELLSPEEQHALETVPALAAVRKHLDVGAWREVWALRPIARPSRLLRAAPVGPGNLLRKRRATLAFLEAHHEDLKRAIALAGPVRGDASETWRRVFRDAERAVLGHGEAVFPELQALPASWRGFALWHQCGDFSAQGLGRVPARLSRGLGDRDGVFASACRQYRRSMNEVAHWARERGLMAYAGQECISSGASLIEALLPSPLTQRAASRLAGSMGHQLPRVLQRTGFPQGPRAHTTHTESNTLGVDPIRAGSLN
jgi:hypothetical protein